MNSLNPPVIKHNIKSFPKAKDLLFMQFGNGNFGRYIEFSKELKAWKEDSRTKTTWISQKRVSATKAFKEFTDLYDAKEYYALFGKNDDSIEVFYREKASRKHCWEPTDSEGHGMQCVKCGLAINVQEGKGWDKNIDAECPGMPGK